MMASQPTSTLLAGAGMADITPALGTQLAGDIGRCRPTEEIRERLYARALVLESAGRRCCLLSLDLLSSTNVWANELRRQVGARLGIDAGDVIFHVTQNHASPSLGHLFCLDEETSLLPAEYPWLRGGDERYNPFCIAQCLAAVDDAAAKLQPVRLAVGRGIDGRVAFNRRFVLRDGTARTHPPICDPSILYTEGPTDPEVGVLTLTGEDGNLVSALLHFTCHPVFGYPNRYVIADWPGAWAELMRAQLGGVPLVVNGCCGNIHHTNHLDPSYTWTPDGHLVMAAKLAETAAVALARRESLEAVPLDWQRTVLRLPMRLLTAEVIDNARRYLETYPTPKFLDDEQTRVDWDWVYAVGTLDLHALQQHDPCRDYEIQAFRLGDFALVTLMGEPFVEAQLRIKRESPAPYTFVAHFCNGYAGYLPTAEAFTRGGYETRTGIGSHWQPEALEQVADTALGMVRRLFAE